MYRFLGALSFVVFILSWPAFADIRLTELAINETPIVGTEQLPKGWAVGSDPELVKFGKKWWMFFNSIQLDFNKGLPIHIMSASLPAEKGLDAEPEEWTVHPFPVISPGGQGAWDARTVETPKYVRGFDTTAQQWVQRIYFAGWPHQKKGQKNYHIGFSQWSETDSKWIKRPDYVVTGDQPWEKMNGTSFIGDQTLYYEPSAEPDGRNGTWHLWYQAVSNDPEAKGIYLVYTSSKDGVSWGRKTILKHEVPFANKFTQTGPFHLDVFVKDGYFYFTGFLYNHQNLAKQGLWITRSATPDGSAQGDFTDWRPLIFENNGVYWHDSGLESSKCHKTGLFSSTLKEENGVYWLFYHGYYRTGEVRKPCADASKNSGVIGRARLTSLFGE